MNRSKVSFEEISSIENCKAAIRRAAKKKKKRKTVRYILYHIDEFAKKLQQFLINLLNGKVELRQGSVDRINEGTRKKPRDLCKPPFFPEQCAHWAILLVVQPVLEKRYYRYSCASVKGRGTHDAKRTMERFCKDGKNSKYCGQFDIKGFFAHVVKEKVVEILSGIFKDKRVVKVLSKVVYSYKGDGLPLGFSPSATFANTYLTGMDTFIKEKLRVKKYERFMDDFPLLSGSKRKLHDFMYQIRKYVYYERGLSLKYNWQIYKTPFKRKGQDKIPRSREHRAIDFLGFKFYRYKTTIRKTIYARLRRNLLHLAAGNYTPKTCQAFTSYNGYLKHTDSANVRQKYIDNQIKIKKVKEIIRNENRKFNKVGCEA